MHPSTAATLVVSVHKVVCGMAKKKKVGTCAYCGTHAFLTLDHVVPQCLFIPPLSGDIPKVWACAQCNNVRKSSDDSYLRDLLVADFDTQNHTVAQQLFAKFVRSIKRHQSQFAKDANAKPGKVIQAYTPGGIYLGLAYAVDLPDEHVIPMLIHIVRGLYRDHFNDILPNDVHFDVQRIRNLPSILPTVQGMVESGVGKYVPVGGGDIFNCIHAHAHDPNHPWASLWFLGFYEKVVFSVAINLQGDPNTTRDDDATRVGLSTPTPLASPR
jgi:hypothetical protein